MAVDPISSKAAAVAGKAISEGSKPSGLLTQIYKDRWAQSFREHGSWNAEKAREIIDHRRENRRERHLGNHLAWASRNEANSEIADSDQADSLALEWVEEIQDVDPADDELTAIWRSLFSEVRTQGMGVRLLLDEAKKLDSDQAKFVVSHKPFRIAATYYVEVEPGSIAEIVASTLERTGMLSPTDTDTSSIIMGTVSIIEAAARSLTFAIIGRRSPTEFSKAYKVGWLYRTLHERATSYLSDETAKVEDPDSGSPT